MNNNFEKYRQTENFVESMINLTEINQKFTITAEEKLKSIKKLLGLLGSPEKKYKILHIAGTSGKGTTCSLIQNILKTSGFKTGLYVSPHPTTSIERIKINDSYISPKDFVQIVNKLKPFWQKIIQQGFAPLTYFEAMLSIALVYFEQKKCDYIILETGLGGKFDATNVIPAPKISAITNINFDHQDYLGNTLTQICNEKKEIIKNGSKFFTTEQRAHLLKILKNKCRQNNVEFNHVKTKSNYKNQTNFNTANILLASQICNSLKIDSQIINKAIQTLKIPLRFEIIQQQPKIILDGAHNPSKIKNLAKQLAKEKYNNLYLVCGFAKNKDAKNSLKHLLPLCSKVYATRFLNPTRKAYPLYKLGQICKQGNKPVEIFLGPYQALQQAQKKATKNDLIVVTGSFFLAGLLRTIWIDKETILKNRKSF